MKKIGAIKNNDIWVLTEHPEGHKANGVKWVYKTKTNLEGKVWQYKVGLQAEIPN